MSIVKILYITRPGLHERNSWYCVGLDPLMYLVSSKPWQCRIEIDLLMLEKIFWLGKHTNIFCLLSGKTFPFLPSIRPNINILIDFRAGVQDYGNIPLVSWIIRRSKPFIKDSSLYSVITDVWITGHIINCVNMTNSLQMSCNMYKQNEYNLSMLPVGTFVRSKTTKKAK